MEKIFILAMVAAAMNGPASTQAATYEIVGPCDETPAYTGDFAVAQEISVGEMTESILKGLQVPYIKAGAGFSSIMNTPTNAASVEYLGATELRAYGWCYSVDGVEPAMMPDQFILQGTEHVRWWYAFSHLKDGEWLSYCEPAYTVKPALLCQK
jgi:hypothetical protein